MFSVQTSVAAPVPEGDANDLSTKIAAQGDLVRDLKAKKADKANITDAVKILLDLKAKYKQATGKDWTPNAAVAMAKPAAGEAEISGKIAAQGDKVRELKAKKTEKSIVDGEVKVLLQLKADYKALTGQEWKPRAAPPKKAADSGENVESAAGAGGEDPKIAALVEKVNVQGNVVRELKAKKAPKVKKNQIQNTSIEREYYLTGPLFLVFLFFLVSVQSWI